MITFDTLPLGSLKPAERLEFDLWSGANGLPLNNQRLLILAQKLGVGLAPALEPVRIITEADAARETGRGSIAYCMIMAARKVNANQELWVVPMEDAEASEAAAGNITLTGTATGPGTLELRAGSIRTEVGVLSGETAAEIATRARAALNALVALPITVAGTTGVIAATFRNKGTCGNGFVLEGACSAAGITVTSANCTGGTTDPDIQTAYDAAVGMRFHVIIPWSGSQADILKGEAHIELVSSATEKKPGRVFACLPGSTTVSGAIAIAQAINHERSHVALLPGSRSAAWEVAAELGMVVAAESDPALPLAGRVLPGIHAPSPTDRLLGSEIEALLAGGVTPLEVVEGQVAIVRLVTTRTSVNGAATLRMIDTNHVAILDFYRDACLSSYAVKFRDKKQLPSVLDAINAENYRIAKLLETREILRDVDAHRSEFRSEEDPDVPGRTRSILPGPIVPGLYQIYGKITLILPTD